jgi:hypothetical protein
MTIVEELKEIKAIHEKMTVDHAAIVKLAEEQKTVIEAMKKVMADEDAKAKETAQKNAETIAELDAVCKRFENDAITARSEVARLQEILAITPAAQEAQARGEKPKDGGTAPDAATPENYYAKWLAISDPIQRMEFQQKNQQRINADFEKYKKG